MKTIKTNATALSTLILLLALSPAGFAFELLSEGAMDSVSVNSGPVADNLLLEEESDDDYEKLPFQTSIKIKAEDTDEVSVESDFALTQEVENWANNLRDNVDAQFEVNTIDSLITPGDELKIDKQHYDIVVIDAIGDETGKVRYERGHHSHSTKVLEASRNSITVEHTAYTERAATIDANPYQDGSTYGSTFLTDIRASAWHRTTLRD